MLLSRPLEIRTIQNTICKKIRFLNGRISDPNCTSLVFQVTERVYFEPLDKSVENKLNVDEIRETENLFEGEKDPDPGQNNPSSVGLNTLTFGLFINCVTTPRGQ